MSYNSSDESTTLTNRTYTTFGENDIPYTQDISVNNIQEYVTSDKSKRSVRFGTVEHISKAEIANRAGYSIVEAEQPSKEESLPSSTETIALAGAQQKPQMKFKLDTQTRNKLRERAPIISGHTLEHFYRYGKPPFLNYGNLRNTRLTRY